MLGIPPPKTTDMPTCRATCQRVGANMSATSSLVGSSDAVSMSITRHVGGAMVFGEVCWTAIEGSGDAGPRRQRRKMSNEGGNSDVVRQEGRSTRWDK